MEVLINETTRLMDIKGEFTKRFPFLKIEFFTTPHQPGEGSTKELMILNNRKVGDIRKTGVRGRLNISGMMTVKELEQKLQDLFGINTQVFRKAGNSWIQTTITDNWTLTEQNLRAEELCEEM